MRIDFWRRNRPLLLILATALLVRLLLLVHVWASSAAIERDSRSYLVPAASLARGLRFRSLGLPELFRTPGYPVFLVLCWTTGPFSFGLAQIVQVLLGVATVYLTYKLTEHVVGPAAGLWAAGLQALSVVSIAASVYILTDCLYSLMSTAVIYLLVKHVREEHTPRYVVSAALLAAAGTYVRPVGLILVPIVIMILLFRPRRLLNVGVFALVFALSVAPWYVRNYLETGYRGFSTVSDFNWLFYEASGVWAKTQGISIVEAQNELNVRYRREIAARNLTSSLETTARGPFAVAGERNPQAIALEREMANGIIRAHLPTFVRVHVITSLGSLLPSSNALLELLGVTSGSTGTLSILQSQGPVAAWNRYFGANRGAMLLVIPEIILIAIQYTGLLVFAVFGLGAQTKRWSAGIVLIALTVIAFVFVAGPAATARMRLPVEPLMNLLAGGGMVWLLNRNKKGMP
jgi:4-amino-4-deoxy-L-arabinose transferase-like glycosyltransferase